MAECGRKALSLLEAARSRYESLQISDDVFGESGDDSSDNPFYSTSGDSDSENDIAEGGEEEEQQQPKHHHQKRGDKEMGQVWGPGGGAGVGPPGSICPSRAEEEGWTEVLQDVTVPPYRGTQGEDGRGWKLCCFPGFKSDCHVVTAATIAVEAETIRFACSLSGACARVRVKQSEAVCARFHVHDCRRH